MKSGARTITKSGIQGYGIPNFLTPTTHSQLNSEHVSTTVPESLIYRYSLDNRKVDRPPPRNQRRKFQRCIFRKPHLRVVAVDNGIQSDESVITIVRLGVV